MNYQSLLTEGTKRLEQAGVPDPQVDAFMKLKCEAEDEGTAAYDRLLSRRETRKPLQQILGHTGFMGLDFIVNEHVLSPRQDTECLVEQAHKQLNQGERLLDLCTGSGCILICLMHMGQEIEGFGVDISDDALKVAAANAKKNFVHPRLLQGDLFRPVWDMGFDMIVSNPPYIPSRVISSLMPEVRDFEPLRALDGSDDGLLFYRRIVKDAPRHLNDGGRLLFEIGIGQKEAVESLLFDAGFCDIRSYKDYSHNDRVISARYLR